MLRKGARANGWCEVTFEVPPAVGGRRARLSGEFNGWSPEPMSRTDGGGFATTVRLPAPGRFRFRYLIDDDQWINDWEADDYVPNGLGGDDSVVTT